jgi:hypothetical protein
MQDLSDKAPEHRGKILGFQQAVIGSVWIFGPAIAALAIEAIQTPRSTFYFISFVIDCVSPYKICTSQAACM